VPNVVPAAMPAARSVLDASGYVIARRIATVGFKVGGRLTAVLIKEGQHVQRGELLATLDSTDVASALSLANAQYEMALAQANGIAVQLKQAEADARRAEELERRHFVAAAQMEQVRSQRDVLATQLATSRKNVEVAQRQRQIAANAVTETHLRAPFSGVIVSTSAQPGEIVSPLSTGGGFTRSGVATLADPDSLAIEVEVSEAYIGRIYSGMAARAVLDSYPDKPIDTIVDAVLPTAQRNSGTVKVRLAFKSIDPRVLPDMAVKVSFGDPRPAQAAAASVDVSHMRQGG
jgi:RND family efflux transporter MFP subunit